MNIEHLLPLSIERLKAVGIQSASLDAELLLAYVLKKDRVFLLAHADYQLSENEERQYNDQIAKRVARTPLAYLTGEKEFFGLSFLVTPDVLIPRADTELLVEKTLEFITWRPDVTSLVDVGTGSGAVVVAITKHARQLHRIMAIDISLEALEVAKTNAVKHEVAERITFAQGNLLDAVRDRFDCIVANLPYLSTDECRNALQQFPEIGYEPKDALYAPNNGLGYIEELLRQAPRILCLQGAIFLEIGYEQGEVVKQMALTIFPTARVEIVRDGCGIDRVVAVRT